MEWIELIKNLTSDRAILGLLDTHTVLIGFLFTVLGIWVKRTKTTADDQILDALKGKIKVVKK